MEQEKAFQKLVEYSKDLKNVDYTEIKRLITDSIKELPIATAVLKKGRYVSRARVNKGMNLYTEEEKISYVKDKKVIAEYMKKFGRANRPHQVMFYGAVQSTEISQARATAIFEVSSLLGKEKVDTMDQELLTISDWKVLEDILLMEMVFSKDAISKNPDTKAAFEHHIANFPSHPLKELMIKQLVFFSNEFAKKVDWDKHWNYKISVAYTDIILNDKKSQIDGIPIEGIAFPSVPSIYKGQNVVLKPETVDDKLKLNMVSTNLLYRYKENSIGNNHKHVTDFGIDNSNFTWKDMPPENVRSLEEIKRSLKIKK